MDVDPALVLLKYQGSFWAAAPKGKMTYGTPTYQEGRGLIMVTAVFAVVENVRRICQRWRKNDTNAKMQAGFVSTQLLNKLSHKVPVAQVFMEIERSSNPE